MRPKLATKFLWTILGIVGLSILSSLVALYGAWRVDTRLEEATRENVPTARAEEVRIMIRERNGLMASYLLDDGKSAWIDRLHATEAAVPELDRDRPRHDPSSRRRTGSPAAT